jgi:translation initiation factor 2 alpha subunit (eIF-2alpha)
MSSHFKVGSGHQCTVLKVNQEQKSLDLSMSGTLSSHELPSINITISKFQKYTKNKFQLI